jgi:hypothetical protein
VFAVLKISEGMQLLLSAVIKIVNIKQVKSYCFKCCVHTIIQSVSVC